MLSAVRQDFTFYGIVLGYHFLFLSPEYHGYMDGVKPFWYSGRSDRAEFTSRVFRGYIADSVLDVGCWEQYLETELPNSVSYTGVDIAGSPDYVIDLEEDLLSRFADGEFETVVCTDVLEHIDNIHETFDDLCRVAEKYVIISLPNNYMLRDLKTSLLTGRTVDRKFYGLPPKPPEDRHKWFFNYEQAKRFVEQRAKRNDAAVERIVKYPEDVPFTAMERFKRLVFRALTAPFYGESGYNNMVVSTLWAVLDTSESPARSPAR